VHHLVWLGEDVSQERIGQNGRRALASLCFGTLLAAPSLLAGPPYVTDDPQPVDFRHWELYLSLLREADPGGRSGDLPHFEVGGSAEVRFNVGFGLDFGEHHHLLFSAGRAIYGCNCNQAYLAYLLTLGPKP
jgi:hypothetical protein